MDKQKKRRLNKRRFRVRRHGRKECPKSSWGAGDRLYSSIKRMFTADEEVERALRREAKK